MNTYKLRHEGSPRSLEGLAPAQVLEGLQEGLWDATDEVMGPNDTQWRAIEQHPQFADAVTEETLDHEPDHEGETHIDMNPLIDVALVLLIFFILVTAYTFIPKNILLPDVASPSEDPLTKVKVVNETEIKKITIGVNVRMENNKAVITVEDKPVELQNLRATLAPYVRPGKTDALIDVTDDVDWATVIAIQDAAKGAGIERAHFVAGHVKKAPAG